MTCNGTSAARRDGQARYIVSTVASYDQTAGFTRLSLVVCS